MEVTAGLADSNGSLLPGRWRDSLHVTCGLTACTPGSAPGPTLGNEYGKTLRFYAFATFAAVPAGFAVLSLTALLSVSLLIRQTLSKTADDIERLPETMTQMRTVDNSNVRDFILQRIQPQIINTNTHRHILQWTDNSLSSSL